MQTLKQANLSNVKKALIRADLDVPLNKSGAVLEPYRLEALLPTVELLLEKGIHPVICGHMGRPSGKNNSDLSTQKLRSFFDAKIGAEKYTLLENLRFDPREETPTEEYAKELSLNGDIYINDSFATCHRDATSITLLPIFLPAYAGVRLSEELTNLSRVTESKETPKIAIVGGVKSSKKEAVYALTHIFDHVLVVGKLQKTADDPENAKVFYPIDYSGEGLDIGPKTSDHYAKMIFESKVVVWAGPAGAYDQGYFEGSRQLAKAVILSKAFSVIGGGDTISCLNQLQMLEDFDFVSTGGGAMLDFLSGKTLPGLTALSYYE